MEVREPSSGTGTGGTLTMLRRELAPATAVDGDVGVIAEHPVLALVGVRGKGKGKGWG